MSVIDDILKFGLTLFRVRNPMAVYDDGGDAGDDDDEDYDDYDDGDDDDS